jgi:hypothetical protein
MRGCEEWRARRRRTGQKGESILIQPPFQFPFSQTGFLYGCENSGNQTVILELIRLTLGSDLNPHRAKVPQGSKANALVLHIERRRDGPRKEGRFWVANLAFDRIDRDGGSRANRGGGHGHGGALTPRGLARSRRGGDAKAIDGA